MESIELTADNPYANGSIIDYNDGTFSLEREIVDYPKNIGDRYEVTVEGDTLTSLAGKFYKNSKNWHVLTDANPQLRDMMFKLEPGISYRVPNLDNELL